MNPVLAGLLTMLTLGCAIGLLQTYRDRKIEQHKNRKIYEDSSTEHVKVIKK